MADIRVYPVPDGLAGMRVDMAVARMTGLSRSAVARIADAGGVLVAGRPVAKSDRVGGGEILEVEMPEPVRVVPRAGGAELALLYEDDDIVVVDKPFGLAAHPSLNFEGADVLGTLLDMGVRVAKSGPAERKGIVHRLDVGTSGCMVVAKSDIAYSVLKQAFRDRTVDKTYHALVQGHPDPLRGTVEAPIGRAPGRQWKMAVREDGRASVTHYETIEAMAGGTLLDVRLETGRTHQIRVHMAALGHPCVGDPIYGADPTLAARLGLERQWLHAVRLGFAHPGTGEPVSFASEYPEDLSVALETMRKGVFR